MAQNHQNNSLRNTDYIVWRVLKAQQREHKRHVRQIYLARPQMGSTAHQ